MSIALITILMFGSILMVLALGVPIAFALGSIAAMAVYCFQGSNALITIVYSTFALMWQILFMAVPLFIFMGAVLEKSGIAGDLYEAAYRWAGNLRGGLAIGTIVVCVFFAAMTGLTGASTVTLGLLAIPSMLKRGYDKHLAIGCVAGGGTLAILIPPSVPMVLLALVTRQSVGKMLMGGVVPGLMIASIYILYVVINGLIRPNTCPPHPQTFTLREKIVFSRGLILPLILIGAVLGTIFFGVATPTEAAAVGAAGTLGCSLVKRTFSWQLLKQSSYDTFRLTGVVMWIGFGATCFSTTFTSLGGIDFITEIILGLGVSRWLIFLVIVIILLLLGCFLDPTSIIMIAGPISFAVLMPLGFHPVWLGVVFVILLECGYLTPPFGFNLFYLKSVVPPEITMEDIIRSILPWFLLLLTGVGILTVFPQLVLWLPSMMKR
jgi:tripartite ATP-independent transporter DctM subunit